MTDGGHLYDHFMILVMERYLVDATNTSLRPVGHREVLCSRRLVGDWLVTGLRLVGDWSATAV